MNNFKILQVETNPGGTRWNPTQEQIGLLERLYRGGMRTPNAQQIEQITEQLAKYGKIEGKNVFYWFQNHKARERQKQKRSSLGLSHCARKPPSIIDTSSIPITAVCTYISCQNFELSRLKVWALREFVLVSCFWRFGGILIISLIVLWWVKFLWELSYSLQDKLFHTWMNIFCRETWGGKRVLARENADHGNLNAWKRVRNTVKRKKIGLWNSFLCILKEDEGIFMWIHFYFLLFSFYVSRKKKVKLYPPSPHPGCPNCWTALFKI